MLAAGWINPFQAPGRWRRANLHTHTTASDGKVSLQERVDEYALQGYDVLAVTDHHAVTDFAGLIDPDAMLVLPGAELHPANPFGGSTYHLICLGLDRNLDAKRAAHPQEIIDGVNARGGVVFLAHPYWCRHGLSDLGPLQRYAGVEVYNYNCASDGRADSSANWDELINRAGLCSGIANDDCHDPAAAKTDTFGAWTWIRAETLTADSVLAALRGGLNYASCGPEIKSLSVEDHAPRTAGGPGARTHRIRVATSPVRDIYFLSDISGGHATARDGRLLEEAEFVVRQGARYVRVEAVDVDGRKAWLNPVPFTW
ncbi:MAG: CehA/McbA family metallohydrolase [Planctomycetota bacterium]|nr:CehA/McbA family metallohydrolase [Planctomycetota bacterium]